MESEGRVPPGIIDDLHSSDMQRYQNEGEGGVTRTIIDEFHSCDIQLDQM